MNARAISQSFLHNSTGKTDYFRCEVTIQLEQSLITYSSLKETATQTACLILFDNKSIPQWTQENSEDPCERCFYEKNQGRNAQARVGRHEIRKNTRTKKCTRGRNHRSKGRVILKDQSNKHQLRIYSSDLRKQHIFTSYQGCVLYLYISVCPILSAKRDYRSCQAGATPNFTCLISRSCISV